MRKFRILLGLLFLGIFLLTSCQLQLRDPGYAMDESAGVIPDTGGAALQSTLALPAPEQPASTAKYTAAPQVTPSPTASSPETFTPGEPAAPSGVVETSTATLPPATASPLPTAVIRLPAQQWKDWPVTPQIPAGFREVYQRGIAQGNNPRAFSILGDCQSQPDEFMGVFDSDPAIVAALPAPLRETVANFAGSFDRYSPTVKDGTTEGALLWVQWNDNKEKKCQFGETPLDCELRVHRPSIVFIHVGTHWETRNRIYLEKVVDILLEHGAAPIVVTKADNREKDERINQNLASLAEGRGLPLWNFWSMVQHLPDSGLRRGSDTYLSKEAIPIHRLGALQALDAVWRAVQ